jgi:translation initiation factor IF-2
VAEVRKQNKVSKPSVTGAGVGSSSTKARMIDIPDTLSVKQLSELLQVSAVDIIKQLMRNGIMANINQAIDYESAAMVATSLGFEAHLKSRADKKSPSLIREIKKQQLQKDKDTSSLRPRPPVVTVMGHVDHGKTRLLDAIRKTHVMDTEIGGITQHIGAYQVEVEGQKITFLDTPGHQAFTAMRARGAQVTDITILVVAADDGVMPQTLEAIDHARAAGVPIVVAINKIDKPEANPDLVKQQLADAGLVIEEWGGDTVCVQVSAKEMKGISELLENLLIVAEMEELKADPSRPAMGVVIEAELDKTKGAVTTVLVHDGTLRVGDVVVVGNTWGRIKAMFNDIGKQVRKAGPAVPVEILGLSSESQVGDTLTAVDGEKQAKELVAKHQLEIQKQTLAVSKSVSLSNLYDQVSAGQVKDEVKVRVIHSSSGNITESDIMLAIASRGIIIGFSTGIEPGAQRLADLEGISIRYYDIIYNLVDDVSKALKGMLKPSKIEVIDGRAELRAVFSSGKKDKVAGVYVTEGKVSRGNTVRVKRKDEILYESVVSSLRRFKDDVREVTAGYECGVGIKDFNEFEVGDTLEFFRIEEVK